jgi:hypothetical protein
LAARAEASEGRRHPGRASSGTGADRPGLEQQYIRPDGSDAFLSSSDVIGLPKTATPDQVLQRLKPGDEFVHPNGVRRRVPNG